MELSDGATVQTIYDDHQNKCSYEAISPPHVYAINGRASEVKATEAKLNGTMNPEALESKYYFQYGTTRAYGAKTTEVNAGSGVSTVTASQAISGLVSSTTYHYRLVAVNSSGTTYGEDYTFTTVKGTGSTPPTVTTGSATGVTATEAIVHGNIDPRSFATTVKFEYGLTTSYGTTLSESAGSGTEELAKGSSLTGLKPSTTYHFRIVGTSSEGTAEGKDATFTTATLTPTFFSSFGSEGTGNGQFKEPTALRSTSMVTCG